MNSILKYWRESLKSDKLAFYFEAYGTVNSIIASIVLSVGSPNPDLLAVFYFYIHGSAALAYSSWRRKNPWLLILMLFYTATNLIGLLNLR